MNGLSTHRTVTPTAFAFLRHVQLSIWPCNKLHVRASSEEHYVEHEVNELLHATRLFITCSTLV